MLVSDLREKALGRVIWQYRGGVKFNAWIAILPDISAARISGPAYQVASLINIDTATGEQLDICGRIAGIPSRPKVRSDELAAFGYKGSAGAQPYGVAPYKGRFDIVESIPLPNYLYRLAIKAKIVKNTSSATIDDVKRGVEFILGPSYTASVIDLQDMSMRVILNKEIPFNVRALLEIFDLVPRPSGVSLEYVTAGNIFSQSGEVGGDPFGGVTLGGAN
jgi:hypothetical protein